MTLNQTLKKYNIFDQFDVPNLFNSGPTAVSFSVSSWVVTPGQMITINIQASEELRDWGVLVDGITQDSMFNDNKQIVCPYQTLYTQTHVFTLNVSMVDMFYNVGKWEIPFTLYMLNDNIQCELLTINSVTQVPQGNPNAKGLIFALSAAQMDTLWDGVSVGISINTTNSPFDTLRLIDGTSYETLAETTNLTSLDNPINLVLSIPALLHNTPSRYFLTLDLSHNLPIGATYNMGISQLTTHLLEGSPIQSNVNFQSAMITVVDPRIPIVYEGLVDDFIGTTQNLTLDIKHGVKLGAVDFIHYSLHDITSGNYAPFITGNYQANYIISEDFYQMINNQFTNLNLVNNHSYVFMFELIGLKTSYPLYSSNLFLVDTTPPVAPDPLHLQTFDLSAPGAVLSKNSQPQIGIQLFMDTKQTHDPESGVRAFQLRRKSEIEPDWKIIATGNVTRDEYMITLQEATNGLYDYAYSLQNNAHLWSDFSISKELDLRGNGLLIDTLFNSPNPFDSRHQNTTLYYTLRENAAVDIYLFDMFGYPVRQWTFQLGLKGGQKSNSLVWDGTNTFGVKVSKGGYILVMRATNAQGTLMQRKYAIGVIH